MDVLIGVVTRSEVGINRTGEVPGRLLQAAISEPTDVQTVEMMQGGDEFNPPPGCRLIIVEAGPDCKLAVQVDDDVPPVMDPGGRRIYALDAEGGDVVAEMQLKNDGTVLVKNGAASFTMSKDGKFTFHGTGTTFDHNVQVTGDITATGTITAPTVVGSTDVTFAGKSAKTHTHTGGTLSGKTGAPI